MMGRTSVMPLTLKMPASTSTAKMNVERRPGQQHRMRCQCGRRVKARGSSAAATAPSRSSSILT